jgi:septin family protein
VWSFWNWYVAITTQNRPTRTKEAITGRTTFVNTLCGKKVLEGKDADDASNAHVEEGVKIKPVTVGMSCYPKDMMVQLA